MQHVMALTAGLCIALPSLQALPIVYAMATSMSGIVLLQTLVRLLQFFNGVVVLIC